MMISIHVKQYSHLTSQLQNVFLLTSMVFFIIGYLLVYRIMLEQQEFPSSFLTDLLLSLFFDPKSLDDALKTITNWFNMGQ